MTDKRVLGAGLALAVGVVLLWALMFAASPVPQTLGGPQWCVNMENPTPDCVTTP
jgi:hypothetical protein